MTQHPLGQAIAQGLNAHHDHMRENHQAHRKAERTDFLEMLEAEGIEAIRQILGDRLDCSNLPPEVAELVGRVCKPEHPAEVGAVAGVLIAIGYTLGQAVLAGPVSKIAIASMDVSGDIALDPSQLAGGIVTNRVDEGTARDLMRDSGTKDVKADTLIAMAKGTLAATQWLQYLRLYPGDGALVDQGLSHTGLDAESQAALKTMRWLPPGPAEALNMATQNIIDMPTLQTLLENAGIGAEWAQRLYESNGATMPPEMAVRLFREGRMTQEQFEQVLLESNLKNKYVPFMRWLQFRPPPMEQTLRMLRNGLIEKPEAVEILKQNGFEDRYANLLADAAPRSTTTSTKNLSPSTILDLYQVGTWSFEQTQTQLELLGYTSDEAYCLVFLEDRKMEWSRKQRAANRIGTRYTGWKIDRTVASSQLDQVGIPPQQRDDMLDEWDAVRETITAHLTRVDIKKAVKADVITVQDGRNRLAAMGYSPADIGVIEKIDTWE